MSHALERQPAPISTLRDASEPTIRLTTSGEIGTNYSFTIIGGTTPIQIDWGDGTLVSPTATMVKGQKAGEEIKIYGDCLSFLATGAKITAITIDAPSMGMLSLADNELTTLDLSKTPAIESLNLQNNHLTSLNVHGLTSISTLNVKLNQLATLDLSGLNTLRTLIVSDNPALTSLEVSTLTSLSSIRADNCALEQIALPASITEFYAKGNKLTTLGEETLSLAKLKRLRVPNNQIAQVTLGECPLLNDLELDGNQLTSVTLGSLPALRTLYLQSNQLDAEALNKVYTALPTAEGTIKVSGNAGAEAAAGYIAIDKGWKIDIPGQKSQTTDPCITIRVKPDKDVYLGLAGFASDSKVKVETDEGVILEKVIPSGVPSIEKYQSKRGMIRIIGLVHTIDSSENGGRVYDIDASQSPKLVRLFALHNTMTSINVKGCSELTFINCAGSELPALDLSDCTELETAWLPGNHMTTVDLTGLTKLKEVSLERNSLSEIKGLSDCTQITELDVAENQLTALSLEGLSRLETLDCRENLLTALDLNPCPALKEIFCYKNAINAQAMKQLFESLPARSGGERGELYAINSADNGEENQVNSADVKIANNKSWLVYDYKDYENSGKNPLANERIATAKSYQLQLTRDYLEIVYAAPHAEVALYTAGGMLLQRARTDLMGSLQLSVAELPAGSYLLSIGGEVTKVMR